MAELISSGKFELVKFVDNGFELEVNVSPMEDTVWLAGLKAFELSIFDDTKQLKEILKRLLKNF